MRRLTAFLFLLAFTPLLALGQGIPVKTVPVAEGDQFMIFPSQNRPMGGVSIALDDPLHDPFVNPARGAALRGTRLSLDPVYYGFASDNEQVTQGSGRTLPVSATGRRGALFGATAFAWQELVLPEPPDFTAFPDRNIDRSQDNLYLFGMGGVRIPGTDVAVGASVLRAHLNGIEGVRMLYLEGSQVDQHGSMGIYRTGVYWQAPQGHAADILFMYQHMDMQHEMMQWSWNAITRQGTWQEHSEYDQTRAWGLQTSYQHALSEGWQLGARATGNWKWHPKIPNYDVMQIPRDPGRTEAYDIGVGLARHVGQATFGLDLVYEPIWSHTWANALTPVTTADDRVIPAGEMTIENHFRFNNAHVRLGARHTSDRLDFALGLNAHHIRYNLDQQDFVTTVDRTQDEHWTEWTLTTGIGVGFDEFEVRYRGALTLGTGQPGTRQQGWAWIEEDVVSFSAGRSDFLVAPNGALTLDETRVFTHQLSVVVPLTR